MNDEKMSQLETIGVDTKDGLERLGGDFDFYIVLLKKYATYSDVNDLCKMFKDGNVTRCFEICHSLKGVFGNLSVKPAFQICSRMVEVFRKGSLDIDKADIDALVEYNSQLIEVINSL